MLQAVLHHKLRGEIRAQIYAGTSRSAPEDIITSTAFGALRYFSATDAWQIFTRIFLPSETCQPSYFDAQTFNPRCHSICFWPSLPPTGRQGAGGRERIEPDVALVFTDGTGQQRVYVIEVKWSAKLSDNQLLQQGDAARCKWADSTVVQLLLTRDRVLDGDRRQVEMTGCIATTWCDVQQRAAAYRTLPGTAVAWSKDLSDFLANLGVIVFQGFLTGIRIDASCALSWQVRRIDFMKCNHITCTHLQNVQAWRV